MSVPSAARASATALISSGTKKFTPENGPIPAPSVANASSAVHISSDTGGFTPKFRKCLL